MAGSSVVQQERRRARVGAGAADRTAALVGLVVAAAGVAVGLLWRVVAPRVDVIATAGSVDYADSETKAFITADALLFLLCLAAGLLAAVAVWRLAAARGLRTLLALVIGSGVAAYVAWRVGVHGMSRAAFLAKARTGSLTGALHLPLALHAHTVLLAWPGAAALAWAGLVLRTPAPPRPAPVGATDGTDPEGDRHPGPEGDVHAGPEGDAHPGADDGPAPALSSG